MFADIWNAWRRWLIAHLHKVVELIEQLFAGRMNLQKYENNISFIGPGILGRKWANSKKTKDDQSHQS